MFHTKSGEGDIKPATNNAFEVSKKILKNPKLDDLD